MINSVQFSSNRDTNTINNILIAPIASDRGSISIISGKNHSGKTYISKRIHRSIIQRNEIIEKTGEVVTRHGVDNIYVNYNENIKTIKAILISRVELITDLLKSVSVVSNNNHKSRKKMQLSDNQYRIQIKEALEHLLFDCINESKYFDSLIIDKKLWLNSENILYRTEILNSIGFDRLFLTPRNNRVIQIFEELTQSKLYFGVNKRKAQHRGEITEFDLRLAFNGEIIIPIGAWSEGQKVLFALLSVVHYINPEILIFDEIENHLHPEYISTILNYLKQNIKQIIITTHHPHIIFSKHVDIVNYLEFEKTSNELPKIINRKTSEKMKAMRLKNELLDKNYRKLISTYKLFDSYDNQLLRFSSNSISDLTDLLVEIFTSLFIYEVVSPKKEKNPDVQSQKLYEIFQNKLQRQSIKVLEFGAGEGRILLDINKILKTTEKEKIKWSLYEPFEIPRKKLLENIKNFEYKDFIKVFADKPDEKFDFIIIPNVLHELTPNLIAEILEYCANSLNSDGCIIIVEIFPLLKPEKYAVPISRNEWESLAWKLGLKYYSTGITFKNAHDAFFVQLSLPAKKVVFDRMAIQKTVETFWKNEVLPNRLKKYDGHIKLGDIDEIPISIGNLSTIASINAYEKKIWRTE